MPHEHINSTPVPRDPDTGRALERVTVGWTRAEELPAGELATGDIRIVSEWLTSAARFPSPEQFDVRIKYEDGVEIERWTEPHTFGSDPDPKQSDVDLCAYCGLDADRACHNGSETLTVVEPDAESTGPHVYEPVVGSDPDPDMDPCVTCGLGKHDSNANHISWTAARDLALHQSKSNMGAPHDPELRAARWRNLGGDMLDPGHELPVKTRAGDGPYRDAIQVVHRGGAPTWTEPCTGFWVTLTRDDANHLVRKLRRAIQEAFGGDA